jgi:hypothetical protein
MNRQDAALVPLGQMGEEGGRTRPGSAADGKLMGVLTQQEAY